MGHSEALGSASPCVYECAVSSDSRPGGRLGLTVLKHRRLRLFSCDGSDGPARHASGARLCARALLYRREDVRSPSSPRWWRGTNRIVLRVDWPRRVTGSRSGRGGREECWLRRTRVLVLGRRPRLPACPCTDAGDPSTMSGGSAAESQTSTSSSWRVVELNRER